MTQADKENADFTEGLIHLVEKLFYRSNGNPEELAASTDEFLKTLPQEGALSPLVHGLKRLVQAKHLSMGRKPESAEAAGEAYGLLQTLDPRMAFLARLLMLENDGTEASRDMAAGELREMISSSRERGDKPLEALALSLLSRMLESGSSFDESVQCRRRAIEIFKELRCLRLEAQVWNGLGILYAFEDRDEDSILAFEQSLALANACENGQMAAGVIMNMGLTFSKLGDLEQESACFARALDFFEHSGQVFGQVLCLSNIGQYHLHKEQTESAFTFLEKAVQLVPEVNESSLHINVLQLWSRCLSVRKAFAEAAEALEAAVLLDQPLANHQSRTSLYLAQAFYFQNLGDDQSAQEYYLSSILHAFQSPIINNRINALLEFGRYLAGRRGPHETLFTHPQYPELCRLIDHDATSGHPLVVRIFNKVIDLGTGKATGLTLSSAHKALADHYRQEGNFEMALQHLDAFSEASQQLLKHQMQLRSKLMDLRLDLGKSEYLNSVFQEQNTRLEEEIEKRKRIEAELEEKNELLEKRNQEKDTILAVVAHDLRNPISAVISIVEMLEHADAGEEMTEWLSAVSSSLDSMMEITDTILEKQQMDRRKIPIKWEQVCIETMIRIMMHRYKVAAEQKGVVLEVERLCESPISIMTDKHLLSRCLENLLSNAVKYSSSGSQVRVSYGREPAGLIISVADQGPGLRPDEMERLYQEFSRLSPRPTAGEPSIGIGLAIVKRFIETLGGSVTCQSEVGSGSTFTLRLPCWGNAPQ